MIPNFDAKYEDLGDIESDPRFMRLCTQQTRALSTVTSRHAQERVRLALAIQRERDALRAEEGDE